MDVPILKTMSISHIVYSDLSISTVKHILLTTQAMDEWLGNIHNLNSVYLSTFHLNARSLLDKHRASHKK